MAGLAGAGQVRENTRMICALPTRHRKLALTGSGDALICQFFRGDNRRLLALTRRLRSRLRKPRYACSWPSRAYGGNSHSAASTASALRWGAEIMAAGLQF